MSKRLAQLRLEAIALRRAGKSRREIKEILRIGSNQTLTEALRGEPPLPSTWRPMAKDGLRAKARDLRGHGMTYKEIAAQLGVSKSSVSLWVRDLPLPGRLSYEECAKRAAAGVAAYWEQERPRRAAAREAVRVAEQHAMGPLGTREILLAGAISYWCEGTKSKSYRRSGRVVLINSDPPKPQAAQPEDGPAEHRRQLPRLPADRGSAQRTALPANRGPVRRRPGRPRRRLNGDRAPGRGFEPRLSGPKPLVLPG